MQHAHHVNNGSELQLDVATLRAEMDPQDLLQEVKAQLRISSAWMSEGGIAQRCRMAKNTAEVVGALIELQRQGQAVSQNRDTKHALWRAAQGTCPAPKLDAPSPHYNRTVAHPRTWLPAPAAETPAEPPHQEKVAMKPRTRIDRAVPILEALQGGQLTREEIAAKTGMTVKQASQGLTPLKASGRVERGSEPRTWALRSGAVLPLKKGAGGGTAIPAAPANGSANGHALRWFLGSDGSLRLEHAGAAIELSAGQFDTIRRAHSVVKAAE